MSLPDPKHTGHTVADWKVWEGRWELIHGMAYAMTPAPSPEHQRTCFRLERAIGDALDQAKRRGGGECELFHAPIDLYLPQEESVYQPDILVVCDPAKVTGRGIEGVPDLVVEILSPSTASKDLVRKRWAYEAAGIPEYLIVDPDEGVAELLRLEEGHYHSAARVEWGASLSILGGKIGIALVK